MFVYIFKFIRLIWVPRSSSELLGILRNLFGISPESLRNLPGIPRSSSEFPGINSIMVYQIVLVSIILNWNRHFHIDFWVIEAFLEWCAWFCWRLSVHQWFLLVSGLFGSKRSGFWTQAVKQHVLTSVPFAFANHCRFQGVWLRIPVVWIHNSSFNNVCVRCWCSSTVYTSYIRIYTYIIHILQAGAPDYSFQRLGYVFGLFGQAQVESLCFLWCSRCMVYGQFPI